jgi:excinuclease ABC subunit A
MAKRVSRLNAKSSVSSAESPAVNGKGTIEQPEATVKLAPAQVPREAPSENMIRVRGARQHNLKNIDLELPRDRLIVFTGVSGSGKSSLAFDIIQKRHHYPQATT